MCIKSALKELGYAYEEHKQAQRLYGYGGDLRQQAAHIIIRRKNVGKAANDVGFRRKSDGKYELLISEYDKRKGSASAENLLTKMKQVYGKHKSLKELKRMGTTIVSVKTTTDGRIKIKARAR